MTQFTGETIDGYLLEDWLEDSSGVYDDGNFSRYAVNSPSDPNEEFDGESVWVCNDCEHVVEGESCSHCDEALW